MLKNSLRDFIDGAAERNSISAEDVKRLTDEVLGEGITSRVEVESLLALDRMIEAEECWGKALTRLVTDFVVWKRAPQGVVSNDDALWLSTVLEVSGPSRSAMTIAYAILDEAGYVDMALLDFIMRGRQQARQSLLAA